MSDNTETERYRLAQLERRVDVIDERVDHIPVLAEKVEALQAGMAELNETLKDLRSDIGDTVKSVNARLVAFAFTVAGSALLVLFGLLQVK